MPEDDWSQREIDRGEALDREVDRLKRVYSEHAELLSRLASTAPTRQLANHYRELIAEVNNSIVKLGEADQAAVRRATSERPLPLEGERITEPMPEPPPAPKPRQRTTPPPKTAYTVAAPVPDEDDSNLLRIVLMVGLALILVAILGVFVWKFSGERPATETQPPNASEAVPDTAATSTIREAVPDRQAALLRVLPGSQDFGVVYKGTRIVKTYELTNATGHDIAVEVSRSKCKCLWFDYPKTIPAGGRGTVSVAVDGSRAPAGALSETIELSARGIDGAVAPFVVNAEIK